LRDGGVTEEHAVAEVQPGPDQEPGHERDERDRAEQAPAAPDGDWSASGDRHTRELDGIGEPEGRELHRG
jgi:hypothetical protein